MENSNFSTPINVVVEVNETDCHAARISVIEKDVSDPQHERFVSITMPASPGGAHLMAGVVFEDVEKNSKDVVPDSDKTNKEKHKSRSMPKDYAARDEAIAGRSIPNIPTPRMDRLREKRFDSFKTWSGKLERNISNLCHHHRSNGGAEQAPDSPPPQHAELPVDRYFDALEGPELETLRASEEIVLPKEEQWPFLLRFPISSFGICLGVGSQAIMWKTLGSSTSTEFLHISMEINLVFWLIAVFLVLIVSFTYILKIVFYFEAVRREYYHPIRVNFLFAPWIALLFLALGLPPSISGKLPPCLWYILMAPIFCLELKIYGQWMSGGERRLSKVANPSNHLAVVGNFVGALLGASMGLKEGPIFFFAIGLAHYTVLFVTLYQRLPTNATLPKELHPVFFLFVAAPSVASMAWATIQGEFGYGSRIAYFIAMFLYFSLAVRVNFFRGFRFSLSWWAYTFPMTGAAIATIRYTDVATSVVTKILTVVLCTVATLVVASLLVTTVVHAFVLRDLFPNDIAIAISERKPKTSKWYLRRSGSSDVEQYLKFADSPRKDVEACAIPPPAKVKQVTVVKDVEGCLSPVVSDVEACMSQMMNDCQACTLPR